MNEKFAENLAKITKERIDAREKDYLALKESVAFSNGYVVACEDFLVWIEELGDMARVEEHLQRDNVRTDK